MNIQSGVDQLLNVRAPLGGDSPDVGGSKPDFLWSAVSGAKAPKVVIPMIASPTHFRIDAHLTVDDTVTTPIGRDELRRWAKP
jgi:hypothetical protein